MLAWRTFSGGWPTSGTTAFGCSRVAIGRRTFGGLGCGIDHQRGHHAG